MLLLPRERVQFLVRELRSHMLRGVAKKKIRKNPVTFAHGCANPYPTFSGKGGPLDTCMTVVAVYASEAVTVGPSGRCLSWQPTPGEAKMGQLAHSSHPVGAADSGCCYSA